MVNTHHLRASIAAVHMVVGEAHLYMLENCKRWIVTVDDVRSTLNGKETLDMGVINHPADDIGFLMTDAGPVTLSELLEVSLDRRFQSNQPFRGQLVECRLGDRLDGSLVAVGLGCLKSGQDDALPHEEQGLGEGVVFVGDVWLILVIYG